YTWWGWQGASTAARPLLHGPDRPAEVVVPGAAHGISCAGKSGLFERREPALPWDEPTYIPPSPEKPEKGIKSPGRAPVVGIGPAFAQDDDTPRAQHLEQMSQRCDLILGAMQGID